MQPPWSDFYGDEHRDVIVVGAGVAGLYIANSLGNTRATVVLEASSVPGGRIKTIYDDNGSVKYESGPWRIPETHRRARHLFRKHGVDLVLSNTTPLHHEALGTNVTGLTTWDAVALRTKSAQRADQLDLSTGYADQTHSASGSAPYTSTASRYFVAPAGFSKLAARMAELSSVIYDCRVVDVRRYASFYNVTCVCRTGHNTFRTREFACTHLFVCVPPHVCRGWTIFRDHARSLMCSVDAGQLNHIYTSGRGPSKHAVSPLLAQTIPSQYDNAWFQASYSGGRVARMWHRMRLSLPDEFAATIRRELKRWFGMRDTGDEVVTHYWPVAYHSWKAVPKFDLKRAVAVSVYPNIVHLPNVLVAGEAFSSHQAWIEGALETAELALSAHRSAWPEIPKKEGDVASIVVEGWPVDVQAWASVHPGGRKAIINHLGEDVTQIMKHIGHSDYAWAVIHSMKRAFLA